MNIISDPVYIKSLSFNEKDNSSFNFTKDELIYIFDTSSFQFDEVHITEVNQTGICISGNNGNYKIYPSFLFNDIEVKYDDIYQYKSFLFSRHKNKLKNTVMQYLTGLRTGLVSEYKLCIKRCENYDKEINRINKVVITQCGKVTIDSDEEFIDLYNNFHHYIGNFIVPLIYNDNSESVNIEATIENCKKYHFLSELDNSIRFFLNIPPVNNEESTHRYKYLIGNAAASKYYVDLTEFTVDNTLLYNLISFKSKNCI